jgi:hypothetical protein
MIGVHLHELSAAGMDPRLGWWQCKNQPSTASVHGAEVKYILKERTVRFRILAVQQKVNAVDHGQILALLSPARIAIESRAFCFAEFLNS